MDSLFWSRVSRGFSFGILMGGFWWQYNPNRLSHYDMPLLLQLVGIAGLGIAVSYGLAYYYRKKLPNLNHVETEVFVRITEPQADTIDLLTFGGKWLPVVLVSGQFNELPEQQRQALLLHETAHIQYGHTYFNYAVFFPLCFVGLKNLGIAAVLLGIGVLAHLLRIFECQADRYAAKRVSPLVLAAALESISPKPEHRDWWDSFKGFFHDNRPDWLEYVPIINIFFNHPPVSFRIRWLRGSNWPAIWSCF